MIVFDLDALFYHTSSDQRSDRLTVGRMENTSHRGAPLLTISSNKSARLIQTSSIWSHKSFPSPLTAPLLSLLPSPCVPVHDIPVTTAAAVVGSGVGGTIQAANFASSFVRQPVRNVTDPLASTNLIQPQQGVKTYKSIQGKFKKKMCGLSLSMVW